MRPDGAARAAEPSPPVRCDPIVATVVADRQCRRSRSRVVRAARWVSSSALQVLVVHLPILNSAFGTVPLSLADWLLCIGVASTVLWAAELRKLLRRQT
ncbi:MAG TPA: cation-translocating P-type ATPase C-terminal domain-containing protein [Candidatus Limnocylindria bacterium]|nr:cation-translocating P-type ATPase C-terminal domain-containing protein [Candidatus Limnocylindria bacterium]